MGAGAAAFAARVSCTVSSVVIWIGVFETSAGEGLALSAVVDSLAMVAGCAGTGCAGASTGCENATGRLGFATFGKATAVAGRGRGAVAAGCRGRRTGNGLLSFAACWTAEAAACIWLIRRVLV